jgi:hypothetical protein
VYTLRAVSITCRDVGDMAIGYVACGAITYCDVGDMAIGCGGITHCDVGDMAMGYVAKSGTLTWYIDTWHIDTWKSIGGIYQQAYCYNLCNSLGHLIWKI